MKTSLKETLKSMQKLGINENKQIEYTKELIPIGKYMEAGDKCHSVIRTKGVNRACWDM